MHQYFLLQNASICTISTHYASKNQNVPIVTLVQNALYIICAFEVLIWFMSKRSRADSSFFNERKSNNKNVLNVSTHNNVN